MLFFIDTSSFLYGLGIPILPIVGKSHVVGTDKLLPTLPYLTQWVSMAGSLRRPDETSV
jgi:hypothetical protein